MELILQKFSAYAWGYPLLVLLVGGGIYFLFYSQLLPFRYFGHALKILTGKFDNPNEPGHLSHYQALSTALAATVGMGNISGVAVAIALGGPGAIFWMWVSALLGVTTKFFTCTLAVMYRGKDSLGEVQGGPMYFIVEGLGKKWKPLAVFFSIAAMIGVSPIFQANQLAQIVAENIQNTTEPSMGLLLLLGFLISIFIGVVVFGGVERIGKVTSKMVPAMVLLYVGSVLVILAMHYKAIPGSFNLIFTDAFTGNAVLGGALGSLIITGIKRAAFSNEAGIGTAPMAHGAAKTSEPVREGLVAMLGPIIDTLIVCTMTALVIIVTGEWKNGDLNGISLTAAAFQNSIPYLGKIILMICVSVFALSTMLSFPYYGAKAFSFLFGAQHKNIYYWFYIVSAVFGSAISLTSIINLIDGFYALMAVPTMVSAIALSPKVKKEMIRYFASLKKESK
jgi:AGCS family alanine or glycine:cation symporter